MHPYMESHECTHEDLCVLAPNSSKEINPGLPIEKPGLEPISVAPK